MYYMLGAECTLADRSMVLTLTGLTRSAQASAYYNLSAPFCSKGLSIVIMTQTWPSEVTKTSKSLTHSKQAHTTKTPNSLFGNNRCAQNR